MVRLQVMTYLFYLGAFVLPIFAQGTNGTCKSQYKWMSNSHGHNPCLLSSYLDSGCEDNPEDAYIYSLDPGFYYPAPWKGDVVIPCECNTVYYAAISACAACQGQLDFADPWSAWSLNCTSPVIRTWPKQVPQGTSIPAWAFLDVTSTDSFNLTAAKNIASSDLPDTSASSILTSPTPNITSSLLPTTSPSPTTASTASSRGSTKAVGPIVGGVIAGTAIVAFASVAVYFIRSRANARHQQRVASTSLMEALASYDKTPDTPTTASPGRTPGVQSRTLYNPDNPYTFPTAVSTIASESKPRFAGFPEL